MNNQIDINFEAFNKRLPDIIIEHRDEFALMHDTKIIWYLDTAAEAYFMGLRIYGESNFSIQKVTDEPVYIF